MAIVRSDRRRDGTRAACQRLVLYAPLVRAHAKPPRPLDLDEIDVRTPRETPRIVTQHPSAPQEVHPFDARHELDVVGNARVERYALVQLLDRFYGGHFQLDHALRSVGVT